MRAAKRWILGISVFCALLPTEVFAAYKCMNPAICRAVCGSETCGKISASNRDMKALDLGASGQLAASSGGASSGTSSKKTYTCSNEAICIAVCGKKTCP
ncbi:MULTISPECIES: hypothetical protein [unclassified Mesorhizobium]|uniref:hypothetical protein n=1 Tax=unclassified Mesorhizobium TaxID=325217 RepID=UPI00112CA067|nr:MULTISPECIES: hypothetical protein [unclassified Mesorhizobium]TPM94449.1 hypothetical protein FJ977_20245 [Mesorhizobium sp. B2-1-3A]BCG87164.1 hypothetical protein MesoLj113c_32740 [Mesorhizobium sp. 113-3-9]